MAGTKLSEIARFPLTDEELMRLPQDGRKYEQVDGEVVEVPTSFEHDAIGLHLAVLLHPAARGRGYLTGSQAGFRMRSGNLRCPDVGYTRKERLPEGKMPKGFADFAPDLCIEIVSPTEERGEMERKRQEYFDSGAQQVWYLYPETQQVRLYTSPDTFRTLNSTDEIDGGDLLPDFRCPVSALFVVE